MFIPLYYILAQLQLTNSLTALPVVVLYMIGQKFMVAGLTAGSVKG
jgi:ABC-type maltose transport system permease subunit